MTARTFQSVWDAIEDSPAAAANMRMRSDLLTAVRDVMDVWSLPPSETADRLGVSTGRLDDVMQGRIAELSLDDLTEIAIRAGLRLHLEVERPAA